MSIVYLDGASNTPLSREAAKAMAPYLSSKWVGNSMSTHEAGARAADVLYSAREAIAKILDVPISQLCFTSGASESNNWAVKATAAQWRAEHPEGGGHIICSALEHDSVIRACEQAAQLFGITVTWVKPFSRAESAMTLEDVLKAERNDTFLICVMAVNNELGIENAVSDITSYAAQHNIKTLVDCTQALGYGGASLAIGAKWPDATFMSFSAHKLYGPTGVGCLITRVPLMPLIAGGAQEDGRRGGTHNLAGIIGMAAALEELAQQDWQRHYHNLTMYLDQQLAAKVPGVSFTVWPTHYTIANLNCSAVIQTDHLASLLDCEGVAVSAGSACDATHNELEGEFNGSHVLVAMGVTEPEIRNTVRLSFLRTTTTRDIDKFIKALVNCIQFCKYAKEETEDEN